MNIPGENMDRWAESALEVNSHLLGALDALRRGNVDAAVARLHEAQTLNWRTEKQLVRAGAADPIEVQDRLLRESLPPEEAEMMPLPREIALEHLGSEANHRLLTNLRAAQRAAEEVERERGQDASLSETLGDYAEGVEFEIYGPVGSRE